MLELFLVLLALVFIIWLVCVILGFVGMIAIKLLIPICIIAAVIKFVKWLFS